MDWVLIVVFGIRLRAWSPPVFLLFVVVASHVREAAVGLRQKTI